MRRLFVGLAMAVLVAAKPELYREKEDFQFSRSSSDEGTKSGYYDAQRGNMGGNYERAHNMDHLAQHQMGGLMKQVQGELGDGSRTRTGNVFTSANSQGVYGNRRYDFSNLGGRNFQDGASYDNSQSSSAANTASYDNSQSSSAANRESYDNSRFSSAANRASYDSSQSSSAANRAYESHSSSQNNARYNTDSQSHNSGLRSQQSLSLQEAQNMYGASGYDHGSQSGHGSRVYTQSGYQGNNEYEHSNLNQQASNDFRSDTHNRQSQIRILVRPGSQVIVPINTRVTPGSHSASYYDQNTANSEAEVLNAADQQTALKPSSNAKHYESSYSYRKHWEKHDVKPEVLPSVAVPTYQIPVNSELYDGASSHHGSQYENANLNLASSQARHHSDFNAQHQTSSSSQIRNQADYVNQHQSALSSSGSNAFTQGGFNSDVNSQTANLIGSGGTKPKSYQSSYSYHKSWERQGDPYVIKPASNGAYDTQMAQRLTDQNQYSSQNYGTRHTKSHQSYSLSDCVIECDPNSHIRVARSASDFQEQNQNTFTGQETQQSQDEWQYLNLGQQTQDKLGKLEDFGQQTQDFGQQTQDFGQQTQDFGQQIQDFSQQTQDFGQQIQDFSQQTQDFGQQTQDFGQQTQDFGQQTQDYGQKTQDIGQQTQDFGQQTQDFGQQTQDFGQQTQDFGQQTQDIGQQTQDFGQQTQDLGQQTQDFGQQTQDFGQQTQDFGQQTQDFGQQTQDFGQQTQDLSQQTQHSFEGEQSESLDEQKAVNWDKQEKAGHTQQQETQKKWDQLEDKNTENQNNNQGTQYTQSPENKPVSLWDKISGQEQTQKVDNGHNFQEHTDKPLDDNLFPAENINQNTQGIWDIQESNDKYSPSFSPPGSISNHQKPLNNLWDKIDNLDTDYIAPINKNDMDAHNIFSQTSNSQLSQNKSEDSFSFTSTYTALDSKDKPHNKNDMDTFWSDVVSGDTVQSPAKEINTFQDNSTPEKGLHEQKTTTENSFIIQHTSTNTTRPVDNYSKDVGRGDIGPDLEIALTSTTENINHNSNTNVNSIEEQSTTTITQESTIPTKPHKVEVEKAPEEVERQFILQNTQQGTDVSSGLNIFHHTATDKEQKNTHFVDSGEKPDNVQQHFSLPTEIEPQREFHNQDHHDGGDFEQHETRFLNFGEQHQHNQFTHHSQVSDNSYHYNLEQPSNGKSESWESHQAHNFQHEHNSECSHQHDFHYQHGINHQYGHHEHGHHQHGYHQHGYHHDKFNHDNTGFARNPGLYQQNTYSQNKDFEQQNTNWESFGAIPEGFKQEQGDFSHENKPEQKYTEELSDLSQQNEEIYSHPHNIEQKFVNFGQQNNDQFPSQFSQVNEQFGNFEKQNVQDFNNFEQQGKTSEYDVVPVELTQEGQITRKENFESFGSWSAIPKSNQENDKNIASSLDKEKFSSQENQMNGNEQQIPKHVDLPVATLHDKHENTDTSSTVPATEKPGFWKSVGNKFSNAKNKIATWFGS